MNNTLLDMALKNLELTEKEAFVPMPGGAPPAAPPGPPMDPAMMGGAPPMPTGPAMGGMPADPAMMGGAPPMPMDPAMAGAMPMDPAMGGMPTDPAMAGAMPPELAGAVPPDALPPPGAGQESPAIYDMLVGAIREVLPQVLQEMGIKPGSEGEGDKSKKKETTKDLSTRIEKLEQMMNISPAAEGEGDSSAAGLSSGSGMGDDGEGAMGMEVTPEMAGMPPMPSAGPLAPNAGADINAVVDSMPGTLKASAGNGKNIAGLISRLS